MLFQFKTFIFFLIFHLYFIIDIFKCGSVSKDNWEASEMLLQVKDH